MQCKMKVAALIGSLILTLTVAKDSPERRARLLKIFEIIKFSNDVCTTEGDFANRGGTCYTADECSQLGGFGAGPCASGFGVCCVLTIGCGAQSRANLTYLTKPNNFQAVSDSCVYRVCKASDSICRIRLDFTTFVIAGPQVGTTSDYGATTDNGVAAGAIGDCVTDTFTLTAPGSASSPIICGYNSGQHMIVDASQDCHEAAFNFGSGANNVSRQWDIKVTQYACGTEMGGPFGCLQYFTGLSGSGVASFNFPTNEEIVSSTVTHLSNQHYTMCFRQEENMCGICFSTVTSISNGPDEQASFGLSVSSDTTNANAVLDGQCSQDFLEISNAVDGDNFTVGTFLVGKQRICGRAFNVLSDADLTKSVCTQTTPFRLTFKSDANEVTNSDEANANEQDMHPGGIIGFNLQWQQISC